jgi:hypothetical protein
MRPTSAQILNTPLAGMDMSTCVLEGLHVDPHDLRGIKVTPLQALDFCSLFGLIVKEP